MLLAATTAGEFATRMYLCILGLDLLYGGRRRARAWWSGGSAPHHALKLKRTEPWVGWFKRRHASQAQGDEGWGSVGTGRRWILLAPRWMPSSSSPIHVVYCR